MYKYIMLHRVHIGSHVAYMYIMYSIGEQSVTHTCAPRFDFLTIYNITKNGNFL